MPFTDESAYRSKSPNGPPDAPPIVPEPPAFADSLIEVIDLIEANRKIHNDAAKALEGQRDALKSILQSAIADAGHDRVYDPFSASMRSVSYADKRTKAMAIDVQVEPCGNSTQVRLSDELRGKVAEILGGGAKVEPTVPPKVDQTVRELEKSRPELERTLEALEKAKYVSREVMERFVGQPTEPIAMEGFEVLKVHPNGPTLEQLAREPAHRDEIEEVRSNRPRPVVHVSPAFGGPKVKLVESQDPEPTHRGVSAP